MLDFPRAARMLHASDFAATLKTRPLGRGQYLVLHYRRFDDNGRRPQLGMIVPKKNLKLSVARNTVKRVLRETFRTNQHQLPSGCYAFRLYRSLPDMSLTAMKALIRQECLLLLSKKINAKTKWPGS